MRKGLGPISLVWVLASCSPEVTVTEPQPDPPNGPWQAIITVPGGEIETAFELSRTDDGYNASLVNGQERVSIDEISYSDGMLVLRFPVFNNEIRAQYADGVLSGELTLVKRQGKTQSLPFVARPGNEHHHNERLEAASVDMSGRWSAEFRSADDSVSPSIGEFAQRGSRLFGTFVNMDGDHRYLSGHVSAQRFKLSTFDGAHAFLFTGTVEDDEIVDGHFWSGLTYHQDWTAVRNADASLPDAYSTTALKPDRDRLTFSFPDESGNTVSLDDEKFDNKVLLVALAGSWCPNCSDEAKFLVELDDEYSNDDFAIVALMFEHVDEHEAASVLVAGYKRKHGIQFDTLLAGNSDRTDASEKLPDLDAVIG